LAVAGVYEVVNKDEVNAYVVYEPLHHLGRNPRQVKGHVGVGGVLVLMEDVGGEILRRFLNARGALKAGAGGGNHAARAGGIAPGALLLFEDHYFCATLNRGQGSS